MLWNAVPWEVKELCRTLWEGGYAAYPVGGCVRDVLLGRTPGDWDVATAALPETVAGLFPRTVPTGLRHGTVTVVMEKGQYEVTTFRTEGGYADGRHPDQVRFRATLEEDLSRRDFTVNAMALSPDGKIVDPFGGQGDLAKGLIRCVGDPDRRFQEDGLRLLRALRFAAQLGFSLEEGTAAALGRNGARLEKVSGERVKAEVEKILLSPHPELVNEAVELGLLARFGAEGGRADFTDAAPTKEARWRALCQSTGLDITRLPAERALRRAVLHPEEEELRQLALTGGALYRMGYRGGAISALRRLLLEHVRAHPEDNRADKLTDIIRRGEDRRQ